MGDFIVTRCVKNKDKSLQNFQTVTYVAPKKKQKAETPTSKNEKKIIPDISENFEQDKKVPMDPRKKQELEMKKARFEVIKFGITGFKKNKAQEAKVALAVSLGARPPRNKKKNYKEILNNRKVQKAKEERQKIVSGATQSLKKPKRRRKFKKESGILGVYGKVQKDS